MITFQDMSHGIALGYPASWTQMEVQVGDRGSIVALASWEISPQNMDAIPSGETRMDISILQWEPLDLDAYVQQRKIAWDASGITILDEKRSNLQSNLEVVEFQMVGANGEAAYFLFALINNRFVGLSGTGDQELIMNIGQTLRILS